MKFNSVIRTATTLMTIMLASTLAACSVVSDEGAPDEIGSTFTPRPSSSSSRPPSPEMPEEATHKTIDGGVSFVAHYYKLVEYGHVTGNWEPLRELTDDSCDECPKFWSDPGPFREDEDVLTEIGAPNPRGIEGRTFSIVVNMRVGSGIRQAGSGIELRDRTEKLWQDDVTLAFGKEWRVVEIAPNQLLPYGGCIADRCRDWQKE